MRDIFDYTLLDSLIDQEAYLGNSPYPFALFDDLFDDSILKEAINEIGDKNFPMDLRNIPSEEVKGRSAFESIEQIPEAVFRIFSVLNGGRFLDAVSKLSAIDGLISDPYFSGGGINEITKNGKLAVHVDGTTHHKMGLKRRINAILYLNHNWDDSWAGFHEQWEPSNYHDKKIIDRKSDWKCIRMIKPIYNRLLIFTTNDFSWHGHTKLLNAPEGITRKSLITYYYTSSRPETDLLFDEPHRALFVDNDLCVSKDSYDDCQIIT
jgi:hypothetical protein